MPGSVPRISPSWRVTSFGWTTALEVKIPMGFDEAPWPCGKWCASQKLFVFLKIAAEFLLEIWRVWHLPWILSWAFDMWTVINICSARSFAFQPTSDFSGRRKVQPKLWWLQQALRDLLRGHWPGVGSLSPQLRTKGCHLHPIFESHRSK